MNGEYLDRFDVNTIDYANRHQLPITLNVITAKKLLGDIDDPVQHEAENIIGESFIIPPKPFPPAFPCSISLDENAIFDYILFRTEEILDDGTIVISNREQENCPFRIRVSANLKTGKTLYSADIVDPTNEELLQYLRFLTRAASGKTISIRVLSLGEELATGKPGNVEYNGGFDKIESEIEFLEKIVTIEHYYNDIITIPEEIMIDDFKAISYLASLIDGKDNIILRAFFVQSDRRKSLWKATTKRTSGFTSKEWNILSTKTLPLNCRKVLSRKYCSNKSHKHKEKKPALNSAASAV